MIMICKIQIVLNNKYTKVQEITKLPDTKYKIQQIKYTKRNPNIKHKNMH